MGLKDLKKKTGSTKEAEAERLALDFIGGAPLGATLGEQPMKVSGPVYKRTTFSLTDDLNKQIDLLSLTSRTFRVTRSDVVRAGVMALLAMPEAELLEVLEKAVHAERLA